MKIVELEDREINCVLKDFYKCFNTGYDFELFLKNYLKTIGLDEIEITRRTRDGGIDLVASRNGIGDFSSADSVKYYIQAKRYKIDKRVSVNIIRELKGVIPFGHKGMLITTSSFTNDAISESDNDISKPVTLVDGKTLLSSCIENGIGFTYVPRFSKKELYNFLNLDESVNIDYDLNEEFIEKEITENDVRARIISVPSKIANLLEDRKEYNIIFEEENIKSKFIKGRNYFSAGLTKLYRKYGLLSSDNIISSRRALWLFKDNVIKIKLKN